MLFDELFNCVLQTIYCSGAREAPTLSFSEGREPLVPGLVWGGEAIIPLARRDWDQVESSSQITAPLPSSPRNRNKERLNFLVGEGLPIEGIGDSYKSQA